MPEYLDILDEKGNPTGQSQTYADVHKEGLIHRTVHVWFFNSKKELLLQKRSSLKVYPNLWDVSVAGHVSSSETSVEAAQREVKEEAGLFLPVSSLSYLFTIEEHDILNDGTYINNEFQDVYLARSDVSINELELSAEEVEEVKWISLEKFESLIKNDKESLTPHTEEFSRLLQYLKDN